MPFGQQAAAAFMLVEPGHLQFLDTMWVEQKMEARQDILKDLGDEHANV